MVSRASLQYWLQYFVSLLTVQMHAGCAHFLVSSCIPIPSLTWILVMARGFNKSRSKSPRAPPVAPFFDFFAPSFHTFRVIRA